MNLQSNRQMPKVERAAGHCPSQSFSHGFGLSQCIRPGQWFVNQSSVVQIRLDVTQDLTGVGPFNQTTAGALTNGRAQFQSVKWREQDGLPASAAAMTQGCRSMVVGHIQCHQAGRVVVGFHRRNRGSTSVVPGMGFGEMRCSRALKAAADLPCLAFAAGTSLIQGLPPWVTMTVSPPCAKSAIVSNPRTASCFVTVFIQGSYPPTHPFSNGNLCPQRVEIKGATRQRIGGLFSNVPSGQAGLLPPSASAERWRSGGTPTNP